MGADTQGMAGFESRAPARFAALDTLFSGSWGLRAGGQWAEVRGKWTHCGLPDRPFPN